jgi:RTX calcium-binding nonapeptide repeat (4 copies)
MSIFISDDPLDDEWAEGVEDGSQRNIPRQMGVVSFPNVSLVSLPEFLAGERPELVGAIAIAIESDATPFDDIRTIVDNLRLSLQGEVSRIIEGGQLDLSNPGPGLADVMNQVKSSFELDFIEALKLFLASFGDLDDLIGFHSFLFAAVDPTLASLIPLPSLPNATVGVLTDQEFRIGQNPIVFSGDGANYQVTTVLSSTRIEPPNPAFQFQGGTSGDDVLLGFQSQDVLTGLEGNDVLAGNDGDDRLLGGEGNDTLLGGSGQDQLFGESNSDSLNGGDGDDLLSGGLGDDVLVGGQGQDRLNGENGDDLLNGGVGDNTLTGGAGLDQFVISTEGKVTITDFQDGQDVLRLEGGLSVGAIAIISQNNSTWITTLNNQPLAILTGVNANLITAADFITV